jgi:hypothetical protein
MGSANLTNAALFAGESGNLELISTISNAFDYRKFEDFVVNQSTQVTSDIYLKYHDLLKNWEFEENSSNEMEFWPNELNPETIFSKFKLGESQAEVTKLKIPKNVSKWEVFLGFLQVRMMEFENIRSVMKFIDASGQYGRRFGEVRSFIKQNYGVQDETYVWKCLMIWLVELYPHRYTYDRPNHTEIIRSVSHSYS